MTDQPRYTNSMCAVYARIIIDQIRSDDPDADTIERMAENVEQYCQTVATEPGETPPQLEPHLFDGE